MRIEEQIYTLKNGCSCTLRSPEPMDAAQMLEYMLLIAGETNNISRYPDEYAYTVEEEAEQLQAVLNSPLSAMASAFIEGRLIGNVSIAPVSPYTRAAHRAGLGIAIAKEFWGLGLGTILMDAAMDAAWDMGFEQVELDVVATNETAIQLYKKFEFEEFGLHPRAQRYRDGSYADLLLMQRTL